MTVQKHSGKEKVIRLIFWGAAELFTVACLLYSIRIKDTYQAVSCVAYAVLISVPFIIEKRFRCRISTWSFLCCIVYAIGPMLGDVFDLYYITSWWDKLLHFIGGVAFGVLGTFLPQLLDKKQSSVLLCAAFSLCFSLFVSVCWEFCEYGMDQIAGTDAQHSSVVHELHSYLLGEETGKIGSIEDIRITTVNGDQLPVDGYLDIGLHDTMGDMLFEGLGALIYAVIYIADKGKHAVFSKTAKEQPA